MPADARPTLKTIAAETGLAVATVSRALKDAPDIGQATKIRVRAAAEKLGYRPNRAGVRLRTGKTNVIALILAAESDVMSLTAQLIYAIARQLRGTAYHLVVMPFFPDDDPTDPVRYVVETGSADGVILNQTRHDDPRIRYLVDHGFPFATHGRTNMGVDHAYVDYDNAAFASAMVAALAARGRRHVLAVLPPAEHAYSHHLQAGMTQAAAAHGLRAEVLAGVTSDSPARDIEQAIAHRMAAPNRPDGLLLPSPAAALAAIAGAEGAGFVLGHDFDAATKEAIPLASRLRRPLLLMAEDTARAGEMLARAVIAAIEHHAGGPLQILDPPGAVQIT